MHDHMRARPLEVTSYIPSHLIMMPPRSMAGFKRQHQQHLEDFAAIKDEEGEDGEDNNDDEDELNEGAEAEASAAEEELGGKEGGVKRGEGGIMDRGSPPPEASGDSERRDDAKGHAEGDSGSLGLDEDSSGGSSEGDEEDEEADGGGGGGNRKPARGGPRPSTVQTPLAVRVPL